MGAARIPGCHPLLQCNAQLYRLYGGFRLSRCHKKHRLVHHSRQIPIHAYRAVGMGAAGGAVPRNHGQNAGKRRFRHQNRRTARRRRCRRTAAFELPGIERSLKAGHQSCSQPPAPPLRRPPF